MFKRHRRGKTWVFNCVLNTDRGFHAALRTSENKMVMYSIAYKLDSIFERTGRKATADKMTAKPWPKIIFKLSFSVNNNFNTLNAKPLVFEILDVFLLLNAFLGLILNEKQS